MLSHTILQTFSEPLGAEKFKVMLTVEEWEFRMNTALVMPDSFLLSPLRSGLFLPDIH